MTIPSSDSPSWFAFSGNKIKSKFERMELLQKLTFLPKIYQFVASPPDRVDPYSVLLFEPRMNHPALRVTAMKKLSKTNRFIRKLLTKSIKIDKNAIFHFFHFFRKNVLTFFRIIRLAITYRRRRHLARNIRSDLKFPEIK